MIGKHIWFRQATVFAVLVAVIFSAGMTRTPADRPAVPGPDDRCPVCGMLVEPYPAWLAQLRLADGTTLFFDGPKDMFKYLQAREKYRPEKADVELVGGFVTSYYDTSAVPLRDAHFVLGSDVKGPMGDELVPHRTLEEAREFLLDHGGSGIVVADEVTPELLTTMR